MQYQVTIQGPDANNPANMRTCRISLTIPFFSSGTDAGNGSFNVVDQGCIVPKIGSCFAVLPVATAPVTIGLSTDGGSTFPLSIAQLFDGLGMLNASGSGRLLQPWAVGMAPGDLTWVATSGVAATAANSSDDSTAVASTAGDGGDGGGDSGGDGGSADA